MAFHRSSGVLCFVIAAAAPLGVGCNVDRTDDAAGALQEHFPDQAARVLAGARPILAAGRGFGLAAADESVLPSRLHPLFPARGEEAVRLELSGGFAVDVRESGLVGSAQPGERAVAYPREDGASFWGASIDGVEEWLHLGAGKAFANHAAASWQVAGGTLRQRGERVEILDEAGDVRLEVSAPEAFADGGARVPVALVVRGATIELQVDADGAATLVDPLWTATASLTTARYAHAALRLADGDVLVAGGYNEAGFVGTGERYLAASHAWAASGSLAEGRHDPSLIALPGGRALLLGGIGEAGYLATTEIYTPGTNTWTPGAPMSTARYVSTASATTNGRVLVAGGLYASYLASAEVYTTATNTWSATGSMAEARWAHAAVTLGASGKVLVVGGENASGFVSSAEVWDPATSAWSPAGTLAFARRGHRASLLPQGKVLVVGGENGTGSLASAEVWDPATNAWTLAASMSTPRYFPALVRAGSSLLVIGGRTQVEYTATTELYDPATNTWSAGAPMSTARYFETVTELPGSVGLLVVGGWNGLAAQASAEIYH